QNHGLEGFTGGIGGRLEGRDLVLKLRIQVLELAVNTLEGFVGPLDIAALLENARGAARGGRRSSQHAFSGPAPQESAQDAGPDADRRLHGLLICLLGFAVHGLLCAPLSLLELTTLGAEFLAQIFLTLISSLMAGLAQPD